MSSLTYVFPGQGAQMVGMGGSLFDEFEEMTAIADRVLGYSVKRLCLEDPEGRLGDTTFTQPALYTVNALMYMKKLIESGGRPDYVAGHSLGEYNALYAAGVFDFESGLQLVRSRGDVMGKASGGGMAAVIGLQEEQLRETLLEHGFISLDIANLNTPTQIAISGPRKNIEEACAILETLPNVKMVVPLKTSGAFHSRYMKEAQEKFAETVRTIRFQPPRLPVISNVTARPYKVDCIAELLISQITHPVKWTESIRYLLGKDEMTFEEIGPGRVLTGLIQKISSEAGPLKEEEIKEFEGKGSGIALASNTYQAAPSTNPLITRIDRAPLAGIRPELLGSEDFRKDYNLKLAYVAGGMYRGISSKEWVVRLAKAGMLGFFGTGGLELEGIRDAIRYIQKELSRGEPYGFNFIHLPANPEREEELADLFLAHRIPVIEASAFLSITPALVKYRARSLTRAADGSVKVSSRIIAKVSRPEVAQVFLSPAPERIVDKLLAEGTISYEQAELLRKLPMADDLCVEADSAGHTDGGVAWALMPTMIRLRDEMMNTFGYGSRVRIGSAGGLGTPEAAAAAFILGADFILTGSINQCTVEAATSRNVKNMLQQINVQDTDYAPAGDMFELGAKIQVLKKGVFFPARANKLQELYKMHSSWEEIDEKTRTMLEGNYFKRSFDDIYREVLSYAPARELEQAGHTPKKKMAMVFRWYFGYTSRLALTGSEESRVDYQVHCGPALGAFNQWVKGTELEDWRNRHVDAIGEKLMNETAVLLTDRINRLL